MNLIIDKMKRDGAQVDTNLTEEQRENVIKAAQGLTLTEAESVFARSLVETRRFDAGIIVKEKEQIVRKSGLLEYYPANEKFSDIGGLANLKDWLTKRGAGFTEKGTGVRPARSERNSAAWGPGLREEPIGQGGRRALGSAHIETGRRQDIQRDRRIERAERPPSDPGGRIRRARGVVDGRDGKGLRGRAELAVSDAGTTSRVFGTFITWLQEKTAAVFIVATANDITQLPPELLRKGRFDEIFFVDLPSEDERREIFGIHLSKRKRDPKAFDLDALAASSDGFSGAEIEQAIVSALFDAFAAGRDVTNEDILNSIKSSVPDLGDYGGADRRACGNGRKNARGRRHRGATAGNAESLNLIR